MENLEDYPYQPGAEERQRALEHCESALRGWGLTMPQVTPLVLDFGLGRFDEIGEIEFWIVNEEASGYCGKFLFVADRQTCPYHRHARKHETFFVMKGKVRMIIDGEEKVLAQGDTLVMPPGQQHAFTGIGPALLLEVSMPSLGQDSIFADQRIGVQGVI